MYKNVFKICLAFIVLSSSHLVIAQESVSELGKDYLALYTTKQFDEITKYYNESSVFEDPTTSIFSQNKDYQILTGPKPISDFLKQGFKNVSSINYNIEREYTSGVIHFTYGKLDYESVFKVEGEEREMKFSIYLTIILTIKDGKVVHHQDIVDYATWFQQYRNQAGAK